MRGRRFLWHENNYLKNHYGSLGAANCAKALNRSIDSVYNQAARLSLKAATNISMRKEQILALHAQGKFMSEIAAELNIGSIENLSRWMKKWSCIPHYQPSPGSKMPERLRSIIKTQTKIALKSAIKPWVRNAILQAKECRRQGWPEALSIREMQTMQHMLDHGPTTLHDLATLFNVGVRRIKELIYELTRRKLIHTIGRKTTSGQVGSYMLYDLMPKVIKDHTPYQETSKDA